MMTTQLDYQQYVAKQCNEIRGNAPNLYTRHQPATGNLFLQFLLLIRSRLSGFESKQ